MPERLLREILLYSKPQVLQLTVLDLNVFITDMLDSLRQMPEAQGRHIAFVPGMTAARVQGDQDKLKQVFINIVRNACEAIAEGETVRWIVDCSALDQVCIQVHNNGNPIVPEILPRLTEPFYTTKSSGTGLGLAIVKRIVQAHGGVLSIQTTAEEGTTVSVQLPASEF